MTIVTGAAPADRDRERIAEIEALDAGSLDLLIGALAEPSWLVRRAVVAALGRLGDAAIPPLVRSLVADRTDERRISATVDALVASAGDPLPYLVGLDGVLPSILCDAAQILGRRRSPDAVDTLLAWAGHADDNVAVAAMEALGRIGTGAELDVLAAAARSGAFFRVFAAIEILARYEDPRALAPLRDLLDDPVAGTEAMHALGRRGQTDAVGALAGTLDSRSASRVRSACFALSAIADRQIALFGTAGSVVDEVARAVEPGSTARLLAVALADGDRDERSAVARVLGWLGDPASAAPLVALLSGDPEIARAASAALGELGGAATRALLNAVLSGTSEVRALLLPSLPAGREAVEAAVACLDDDESEVRRVSCEILARSNAGDAVPALFRLLDDEDPRVAQAAVAAIQALGHDSTERLSLDAARAPSLRVRRAGLRLLGYFGWDSGIEPLLEALSSADVRLRETALASLAFVEDPRASGALLAAAGSPVPATRAAATRALGSAPSTDEVVACVTVALSDSDPWVRYYACQSLGRLGAVAAVDALVDRLADPATHVRIGAVDALARIPDPSATRALLAAVESPDPELRRAALLGLGTARPRAGLDPILAAISDPEPTTRLIALAALGGFDDPRVEAVLVAAAEDGDERVRETAIGVLAGRPGPGATAALVGLLAGAAHDAVLDALTTCVPGRIPGLLYALECEPGPLAAPLASALARMRRPDAHAALGVALVVAPVESRRAAAAALAAIGAGSARLQLETAAVSDPDAEVRRLARRARA